MQRLRIRFSREAELKYISHLDMVRLWHRAFIRAGIALAYSEGFSPHPRILVAAPLAVGLTSEAELMDVYLDKPLLPPTFNTAVSRQLPAGIRILQVQAMPLTLPPLQAQIRFADYQVRLATKKKTADVEATINALMEKTELPWEHQRDTGPHRYDLRALIEDIRVEECAGDLCTLEMRLRNDSSGSGRPEQVAAALGFKEPPQAIKRTRLIFGLD